MKIAICDDEEFYRAQVLVITQAYASQNEDKEISITAFAHGEDLLEAAEKTGGFDIYILDILMPEINGIELGIKLRQLGYDGRIIYLTASSDHAIDSYKAKAFNYILKPFKKDDFFFALSEVIESFSSQTDKNIVVKTKERSVRLAYDNIMSAELCKRCIIYHLTNGTSIESITIRTSFSEAMQELLQDNRFILCGSSKVVNLQHVTIVENDFLIFKDNQQLYLPKKACREVRTLWLEYWSDKQES